ncbi:MAG: PilZ domain-containing protein [Elusimicrobiota bacterium]
MKSAPFFLAALLRFPGGAARQDAWGRLTVLTAGGARLSTGAVLAKGEGVSLHFELAGERLRMAARVVHVDIDDDGHRLAELRWTDMVERRDLARVLIDVLSRS